MFSSYMEWFSLGLAALMGFVLAAITFFSLNIVLHLRVANWQIWALENVRNVHELKTRAKFQGYWIDDKFDLVGEKKKKCLIDLQKNFERPDVPETVEVDYQETLENVVTDASLSGERQAVLLMKERNLHGLVKTVFCGMTSRTLL